MLMSKFDRTKECIAGWCDHRYTYYVLSESHIIIFAHWLQPSNIHVWFILANRCRNCRLYFLLHGSMLIRMLFSAHLQNFKANTAHTDRFVDVKFQNWDVIV